MTSWLRQTNWNGGWFWKFLEGQKRVFLKHLWNENFAYFPSISLRTRLCWLSLAGNSVICILFLDFVRFAIGKKKPEKIRASMGFEPVTSAIPVRCSTNWAMKRGQFIKFISSRVPQYKYESFHIKLHKNAFVIELPWTQPAEALSFRRSYRVRESSREGGGEKPVIGRG